jgi:hypothetical protein
MRQDDLASQLARDGLKICRQRLVTGAANRWPRMENCQIVKVFHMRQPERQKEVCAGKRRGVQSVLW